MKLALIASLVLAVPSLARAETTYNDAAKTVTHDCAKDADVAINASSGSYTFTGACKTIAVNGSSLKLVVASAEKIEINGSSNEVDADAVDKISVTGSSNKVVYKKGVKADKVKTSNVGTGNTIAKKK